LLKIKVLYAKKFIGLHHAGCPGLSPAISAQFTLEISAAAENCKKTLKFLVVHISRSLKVIDVDTILKLGH